jgi:hypothetical protein
LNEKQKRACDPSAESRSRLRIARVTFLPDDEELL